ncbi:uncharacterized protein L3040_006659 [Drepanopeziza brunnea f. sp. 'multigermtubi']|uniref:uncharacterized protein n=1 Tax=Drepanopeziza brunnea f. sp. 'multigermtubi' TaxID=698441 RepID=UPI00238FBA0D|nr:hypothetical protein L3040_006659 [Drepanopeziza brunnea f. sp. 'multigermtubi']
MYSSLLPLAASIVTAAALPAPQTAPGSIALGKPCSTTADCAGGAGCYSTNSMLIKVCGNFQASCSSDSQCAFNTCNDGLCNGFIATNTTSSEVDIDACTVTSSVYVPLGEVCDPNSTPCLDGADCYAVNSMQQPRCGNFQSSCTSDSQCAFNTCNKGLCNGFIPTTTTSSSAPVSTPTTVYLPLGANCSPNSTPCANGANCYAVNSMLQPRCGNFQSSCTSDDQCAFNTCNEGLCNGFIPTTTASSSAPVSTPTTVYLPLGANCSPNSTPCANGANCYAVNSMLQPRCGNFQSSCTSDDQCAFNTCNEGLCNGFIASSSTSSAAATAQPTSTPTIVYLPLGANCSPNSTPCANGANCYAVNSMLQPRCGNFQSSCTSNDQCAFNTCVDGLCSGFLATSSSSSVASTPTN